MRRSKIHWYKYASPAHFYPLANKLIPWVATVAVILFIVGIYVAFFDANSLFSIHRIYLVAVPGVPHPPGVWRGPAASTAEENAPAAASESFEVIGKGEDEDTSPETLFHHTGSL